MVYLNNDDRWNNLREHYIQIYGRKLVTLGFGVIISFICPLVFGFQNILLGLFLTNGKLNFKTFRHVFKTTTYQLVIIYDLTLFDEKGSKNIKNIWRLAKLAIGYFFYVLPIGIIFYSFLFVKSNSFFCQEMKSPFLLDNNYKPVINMTEMYQIRITDAKEENFLNWEPTRIG